MSRELAEKRKTLQQLKVRYTLAHPATLRFTWKGKAQSFTNGKEAEKFINLNCNADG